MTRTMVGWGAPMLATAMLAGSVLWGSSARATVMVELLLEDMARDATAIVHGRVVRSGTQLALLEGTRAEPYTVTTIQPMEWIKGPGGDEVVLRERGGEIPGVMGMAIDGVPNYRIGEEVVIFLEEDPEAPRFYRTYGMVQGKWVVRHGVPGVPDTVVRDAEAISFARWTEGGMTLQPGDQRALSLEDFLDRVASALRLAPPRIDTPQVTTGGGEVSR